MTLSEKQQLFTVMVANLIHWAEEHGYRLTFGEAYRTPEQAALNAKKGSGITTVCIHGVWQWILTCLLTASTRPAQRITCRWANTGSHWAAAGAGASNPGRMVIISVWNMTGFADGSCGGGLAYNGCSGLLGRLEGG